MPTGGAIAGGAALLGSILSNKSAGNAQDKNAQLYNQYLQHYGQGQQGYLDYLKGLGPQTSTSSSSGTSTTSGVSTSDVAPYVTPQFSGLVDLAKGVLTSRLSGPGGLPAGYAETGIRDINQASSGAMQAVSNLAARRGLSGVQAAALATPIQTARAAQVGSFQANLPIQAKELQTQDVGLASQLASMFGRGQRGVTTNRSTTNFNQFGSLTAPPPIAPLGAFLPPGPGTAGTGFSAGAGDMTSLAGILNWLRGQGLFKSGGSAIPSDSEGLPIV
jgi:hypothetical protein